MLLLSHALEKGMGVSNVKKGYGMEKAMRLIELLIICQSTGETNSFAYIEAKSIIESYIEFQNSMGVDVNDIVEAFQKIKPDSTSYSAGFELFCKDDNKLSEASFADLVKSRHSIRQYSFEEIQETEILRAIDIARFSPSACNRQPCKVYYTMDIEKNKILSKMVPGNKAFPDDIPYYCIVTADRALFQGGEAFQWYVNGGIFIAYLTLAMHSIGIGSCIFQWPDFYEYENQLRQFVDIPEQEAICAMIGFGKYPDKCKVLCAQRKSLKETAISF